MSLEMLLLSGAILRATALYGIQMMMLFARLEIESPCFLSPNRSALINLRTVIV